MFPLWNGVHQQILSHRETVYPTAGNVTRSGFYRFFRNEVCDAAGHLDNRRHGNAKHLLRDYYF